MNNKRPMFSIIIPAYNIGTCISDSIASVLGQDFRDFECIIVDDGSTDGSGAIAAELIKGDDRFVLFEQKNKGVSAARNKGFEESKGKYILFLDGDDIFQVNLLSTVYNRLKVRDVDLLIYNYKIIDNITGRVGSPVHELKEYAEEEVISPIHFANKIFNTFGNQAWTKVFSGDFLRKKEIKFDVNLKRAEDMLFTYSALIQAGTVTVVDEALVSYRINRGTSNSDSLEPYYKDIFTALDNLYLLMKSTGTLDRYLGSFLKLYLDNSYYNLDALAEGPRFKEEFALAKTYEKRFNFSKTKTTHLSSDQLEIKEIIANKDHGDMLAYIVLRKKKELLELQTKVYYYEEKTRELGEKLHRAEVDLAELRESCRHLISARSLLRNVKVFTRKFLGQ